MSVKAKDSPQVQKTRKKLKKQMESEERLITNTALEKMSESITRWISRHANERVHLKHKSFSLFDEKRHPARTQSKYIYRLMHHLKTELARKEPLRTYKGRILPT